MLAELETALISALKSSSLGPRLKTIDSLPRLTPDIGQQMLLQAPALYVGPSRLTVHGPVAELQGGWLCLARHAGGPKAAHHGDSTAIGLYPLIDALLALAPQFGWQPTTVNFEARGAWEEVGLVGAIVSVEHLEGLPEAVDETTLAAFQTFHADLDIAPHTPDRHADWAAQDYTQPPGAPVQPDTQDDITLPQ